MQPQLNDLNYKARRALVLGTTGTGKTTLVYRLAHSHPADCVFVYDWQGGEFATRLGARKLASRDEVLSAIDEGERIVAYDAESGEEDASGEGFEWFCDTAFETSGVMPGRKLFIVDECQDLIDPYNVPDGLQRILSRGRRRLMDTCLAGRSANALHTVGRDQVSELYCFRCIDENSLKYPKSIGLDPEEVKSLPDTHFFYRDLRTGDKKRLALWENSEP